MRRTCWSLAALLALVAIVVAATGRPAHASSGLFARMVTLNPHLKSYEAAIHADVHMTSFPYLNPVLDGTYYHKAPSMDKIVFTSGLPGIAKQFSKIYPRIPAPAEWNRLFRVTQGADDGKSTTFTLVPRKHGRIDHIDVLVSDADATISYMRWNYNDGSGYAEMHQEYADVNGNLLVSKQTGHVEQSIYKADIDSTLGSYKLNPPLTDAFFTETQ